MEGNEGQKIKSHEKTIQDANEKVVNLLRSKVAKGLRIDFSSEQKVNAGNIIKNANNKFLLDVLSPEIKENEKKKREHKDKLLRAVQVFLAIQFLVTFAFVGYVLYSIVDCHKDSIPFSSETIQMFFTFISAYITAVIVELIAILNFIVKNVFDTSITEMVAIFKDESKQNV